MNRLLSLALIAAGMALAAASASASILVTLTSPAAGHPALGEVEMAIHVVSHEAIAQVRFFVDDRLVGVVRERPYQLKLDVGVENKKRRFSVEVEGVSGAIGTAALVTPELQIDDSLDVSLQQLYVTVSHGSRRVLDLERGDFQVLDGGAPQDLITFERGDVPFTAVLLLDSSESMRGDRLPVALGGARAFLGRLQPLDEVKAVLFSDRVLASSPFGNEGSGFLARLTDTRAMGGTALNDHLYAALNMLDRRQGRRVVILLSDGADVVSVLGMQDVLWKVRRSNALIYWLRLEDELQMETSFVSSWRDLRSNQQERQLLEQAVRESGGRVQDLESIGDVDAAFDGLLQELRDQYVLGYYPSRQRHDGSWRPVKVYVRGGHDVRTREGYIDR